ncbi:MAG: type IV pilin [Methanomicrobiales archaeon]|nr:type IV pilin [Methanomicrobiales archaeon]
MVAAVLLVGLTVLGVAIVAAIFLSSSQPEEIPHAAIVAGNRSGYLALTHEGGDSLKVGEYRIYAGTGNELQDVTDKFTVPPDGMWSIGETLVYNGPVPERVIVVSRGTETILSEPTFVWGGKVFDPDPVVPGEPGEPGDPEEKEPIDIIIEENVFVYGSAFKFGGANANAPNATVVITGGLNTNNLNGGAFLNVSNFYFGGNVNLDGGSASLGSEEMPGIIYVNGDLVLWEGGRNIYGDVYVDGDFRLKDAKIHGDVYVNGDLTLGNTPWIAENAHIYYTGKLKTPEHYDDYYATNIVAKCIHQATVPKRDMPDFEFPSAKSPEWYDTHDYKQTLTSTKKVYAPSYTASGSASNIIVVAHDGDISVGGGGTTVTGVLFAPKGSVTFSGNSFEGVVIARDGFFISSGGTKVTFKNIQEYISDPEDYPF